jgi:hypothetical protein
MKRERMRSRFHVAPLLLAAGLFLSSCSSQYGSPIVDLPASAGWQPLPIGAWVLNDGLEARSMAFCPRNACIRQGFAAVVAFEGAQARGMEQALSEKPAELARSFARLAAEKASARAAEQRRAGKKPPKPKPENSVTDYARFDAAGANGILVTIRAKDAPARQGVTAILYGRENDRLVVALAVSDTADAAKHDAEAAWRSR